MITPAFGLTATERVLPRLALDFTTATLDPRITFTRATGASNPATFINSSGVITAATNNQPRFDYDPVTLVCRGLLIEESRTNSLLSSDTLSTQSVTVTAAARTLSFYGTGQVVLSGAHSATVTGTGAYPTRTTLTFTPSAGTLTLTVTGTVQYAQLEAGAFATSYIPTTTTALTRNADVASMTGTNFSSWYNQPQGTFFTQYQLEGWATTQSRCGLGVSDGTTASRMRHLVTSLTQSGFIGDGSGTTATLLQTVPNVTQNINKSAAGYRLNSVAACANAGNVGTNSLFTPPTVDRAYIGSIETNGASAFLNGWIQKINYYPQRLSNAEIQAITK